MTTLKSGSSEPTSRVQILRWVVIAGATLAERATAHCSRASDGRTTTSTKRERVVASHCHAPSSRPLRELGAYVRDVPVIAHQCASFRKQRPSSRPRMPQLLSFGASFTAYRACTKHACTFTAVAAPESIPRARNCVSQIRPANSFLLSRCLQAALVYAG